MELFNVDLSYFAERVPVINDIANIFVAVGWALLIGNLAYQALRSMASGTGIEAEDPGRLFLRTAMFSFLLLVSRQICDIGFGLSATVMEMLQVPDAVTFEPFGEETFDTLPNAGWLIVIIVNIVIQWQLIRLFFEVAERYVILCVLTYCAPLAFAMGGAKSTSEIFRGWLRMFASMCALMVFNLMFVKLVLSALSTDPNGLAIIPWAMLVVGIVRMAKKMDGIILRIGMNPALTGDPLGMRFPGALTAMTLRSIAAIVTRTAATHTPSAGHSSTSPGMPPRNDPTLHGSIAGGASNLFSRTGRQGAASAGTSGKRTAAISSAAAKGAGSGGHMAGTIAAFRSRYGANNPETMREVRQMISIDADDWNEDNLAGSNVVHNDSSSQVIQGTNSRVTPPNPPLRPLSADFGRMSPPETDSKLPPVMPSRTVDGQISHMVSPVTPQIHILRSPEQALQDFSGRNPAPEANEHTSSALEHGKVQTDYTRQAGKISPVMPSSPRQMQQNRMGVENHTSISNTEQPVARVTPSHPSIPAGGIQQVKDGTVAASDTAAVTTATAAAVAGSTASGHTDKTRISPAREAPPQAMRPVPGSAASPARQQAVSAGRQAPSGVSARVTPTVPHKPPVQTAAQVTPVNRPDITLTASPQVQAQPSAKIQPDVTPANRRPAVTPARRERKLERPNPASRLDVSPGVRTPDMVTPPPTSQPRALRRSAQPLKNKVTPERSKKGGTGNRKRKRKK